MDWYTMQGDTRTAIQATLSDSSGNPVDLTGATVLFRMAQNSQLVISRTATVTDAAGGVVLFVFQSPETDTPGAYPAEFKVTYGDGSVETFPNAGGFRVIIQSDIA